MSLPEFERPFPLGSRANESSRPFRSIIGPRLYFIGQLRFELSVVRCASLTTSTPLEPGLKEREREREQQQQ